MERKSYIKKQPAYKTKIRNISVISEMCELPTQRVNTNY